MQPGPRSTAFPSIAAVVGLVVAIGIAYANHFQNGFHFDDAHTIENNTAIRELRNIPLFFSDASTFSSLPSNQSYRPLVSTLLAIDYWLGGGLHPFWFHASIFTLFLALTLLLAFFIHRLIGNRWIAVVAAAWYGLHPANADTINYIISSSEVISTLGVVASFAIYLAFPQWRRYYLYVLPAAVVILAKPPAAIFALLFAIYRLMFAPLPGHMGRPRWVVNYLKDIVPSFVLCGAMLVFVQRMTPRTWTAGAASAHNYLITQPYVAWLYLKTFFWPNSLSADYDLSPFTATGDPRFWVGITFAVLFTTGAIVFATFRKTRAIGFGLLWFVITLLPTSLLPLAEVMNDHRTFLPYAGLVIAAAGAVVLALESAAIRKRSLKIAIACLAGLFLSINGYATFQRNKVWKTEETLWRDVTVQSPKNGRGWMNYGNSLMARADYGGALDCFHRALVFNPRYAVLFINLAIAENAIGQTEAAEKHFEEALRLAPSTPDSYTYYARYLIAHSRGDDAVSLIKNALELSPSDAFARDLLVKAQAEAAKHPAPKTPESYLNLSLKFYQERRYVQSVVACRLALDLRPEYPEAWNNLCAAYNNLGRYQEAVAACEQALRYKPDYELARNNLQYARSKETTRSP